MKKNQFYILQSFLFGCLWLSSIASFSQTAVLFNVTNLVQTATNAFRYDVMMTNTGTTAISLRGYSWGLNTATGIANGGTISQTFISRDASIDAGGVPAPSAPAVTLQTGTCAGAYHLRFTTLNAAGNGAPITANVPIRLATIQVQTSASSFPLNFNPFTQCSTFAPVQNIVTAGKTACVATCIVTPPATSYQINGTTSAAATGTLQALTATMTPNPASVSPFILNPPACVPVITNVSATACNTYTWSSPAGNGSTYTASGTYIKTTVKSAYCYDTTYLQLTISNNTISSSTQTACNAYTWPANGMTYTASGAYTSTSLNAVGCVNTATLNLIMNNTTSSISQTTCNSFTWSANGMTYTTSGAYTSTSLNASGCVHTTTLNLTLNATNSCNVALQLKLFIQGYYDQASTMLPVLLNQLASTDNTLTDTILVELHSALFPYGLEISQQAILHTNGTAACTFNYVNGTYSSINGANYLGGNLYYVAIRHRNGLLTWSANPIAFDSTTVVYDFSSSSSKAYGDNMLEVDPGVWAMYSADLNQDQNVDLLDMPILEADVAEYMYGYAATDLNGDGNTDLLDVIYMDYGIAHYLFSIYPVSATLPTVSTNAISAITYTTASSGGIISNEGGAVVSARGVCWSTSPNPTVSLSTKTLDGIGSGIFTSSIAGLVAGTTYYVRAYATNSVGTAYGSQVVFTTEEPAIGQYYQGGIIAYILQPGDPGYDANAVRGLIAAPSDQSTGIAWWNGTYATTGAEATALGAGNANTNTIVAVQGIGTYAAQICYDLVLNGYSDWYLPSQDELNKLYLNQAAIGGFAAADYWSSSEFNSASVWSQGFNNVYQINLLKSDGLYIRAIRSFSTSNTTGVTTNLVSSIQQTTATCGGSVVSQGGAPVIARGVCWSTSPDPTVSLSTKSIDGSGNGSFTSIITGLVTGTTYYVRAYATNSVGTAYGNQLVFMTTSPVLSALNTTAVSGITYNSASSGGNITSDGGAPITARGVCWSTSSNPTIALTTKTINGSGTGSFTSSITGLAVSTAYYVRAYATNSEGTAYGNEVVFTTTSVPLAIGQSYQGGIIAYILQAGDPGYDSNVVHGLIAAPSDQSALIQWWNGSYVTTGATATALGTGNSNSNSIVTVQGNGTYPAKLCYDLVFNGYSDWYLPSKDELNKLYLNKNAIGGFAATYYWSSSDVSYVNYAAWSQGFNDGGPNLIDKANSAYVRAVRAFSVLNTIGVVTTPMTSISQTSATCGGSVVSQGGSPISARGVCWSTSPDPTVSLSTKTIDGSGIGSFASSITGLNPGTTYHVRAYATSSAGTVYGNDLNFTTSLALAVGQIYQGGKIAYILQPGDPGYDANVPHGLIAAPSDQSIGIAWWNGSYVTTGATALALGTGNANTNTIVSVQGAGSYAAKLCYDLVLNGYSDWFLPSKDELNKLYLNRAAIGGFATAEFYWSSSEASNDRAWFQHSFSGVPDYYVKDYPGCYVRAVRAF